MIIDCISDLHGYYPKLEGGDLLIIAGDITGADTASEWNDFKWWLEHQNYRRKVLVPGNHDMKLYKMSSLKHPFMKKMEDGSEFPLCDYLCDSGSEFQYEEEIEEDHKFQGTIKYKQKKKLKIWGSPWTKWFNGLNPKCAAFTYELELYLEKRFDQIPDHIDILITHSPPYLVMDKCEKFYYPDEYEHVGSPSLRDRIEEVKPKLHVFGHIHEGYGQCLFKHEGPNTICVNASIMNEKYQPVNKPIRVVL